MQMIPLLMRVKEESETTGLKLNIQKIKTSAPITSRRIDGETMKTMTELISWAPKPLRMVTAAMKLKDACSLEEKHDQPRQHIKNRAITPMTNLTSQSYGFSSSHVWM